MFDGRRRVSALPRQSFGEGKLPEKCPGLRSAMRLDGLGDASSYPRGAMNMMCGFYEVAGGTWKTGAKDGRFGRCAEVIGQIWRHSGRAGSSCPCIYDVGETG